MLTLIDLQNDLKVINGQISVLVFLPFLEIATAQKLFNIECSFWFNYVWVFNMVQCKKYLGSSEIYFKSYLHLFFQ